MAARKDTSHCYEAERRHCHDARPEVCTHRRTDVFLALLLSVVVPVVALAQNPEERVNPEALRYINRVSDFLFVAGRVVNDNGNSDVLWVPGENR